MEQSQAAAFPPINEEDDDEEYDDEKEAHCDLEAIEDLDHLTVPAGSRFTRSQGRN
jgi:hypothetical protein